MPRKLLQHYIDSREFTLLLAAESLNPRGEVRADMRSAMVAMTIANVYRDSKSPPFKLTDFMLNFGDDTDTPTDEQLGDSLRSICMAFGGEIRGVNRETSG